MAGKVCREAERTVFWSLFTRRTSWMLLKAKPDLVYQSSNQIVATHEHVDLTAVGRYGYRGLLLDLVPCIVAFEPNVGVYGSQHFP
jgi:hypothetical protein